MENAARRGRAPEKLLGHLRPGTLVITPGDRSDAILATALIAQRGMPLAGFLFTCGGAPAPEVMAILRAPPLDRLPMLSTPDDTFTTATRLAFLRTSASDDGERMERVIAFIADRVDIGPARRRLDAPVEPLMPPPVFRHRLVEAARAANRAHRPARGRRAAHRQGRRDLRARKASRTACCSAPERIRAVAQSHGVELPADVEIVDPETIRAQLRRARWSSSARARD